MTASTTHNPDVETDVLTLVPVPRTPAMDWPGDGEVVFVPASLMLAAGGRCSCPNCVDGFVHMMRRARLRSV